jgi:hypothetical protein
MCAAMSYWRPSIPVQPAPDLVPLPTRFRVRVRKRRLVGMVLREIIEHRGNLGVALSRPCVYGVFSGRLGGLRPHEERCVGCLRCTVQYPQVVQIEPNPLRARLGDSSIPPECVETVTYEARTGRVPVHGAGYRGPFGGSGWDGMWLDMSEIVRPTRDGIHGREFIATTVDVGAKPAFLHFDEDGQPSGEQPYVVEIAVPYIFDASGVPDHVAAILADAARQVGTLVVVSADTAHRVALVGAHVVPLVRGPDRSVDVAGMVMLDGWNPQGYDALRRAAPEALIAVRLPADHDVLEPVREGAAIVHLVADEHGRAGGRFLADLIRDAHERLVAERLRDRVTLLAGGGIVMAEHVPKAIACGVEAVVLGTALRVALQGDSTCTTFPSMAAPWGVQRITNLTASWRDQLLEVLGAMGMREVRRLRGEYGRLMLQRELELDAFGGIEGYDNHAQAAR